MLSASFLALALNNFIQHEQWNSPNSSSRWPKRKKWGPKAREKKFFGLRRAERWECFAPVRTSTTTANTKTTTFERKTFPSLRSPEPKEFLLLCLGPPFLPLGPSTA